MKTLFTGTPVKLKLFIKMKIIFLKAHFILDLEGIQDVGLRTYDKIAIKILKNCVLVISKLSIFSTCSPLSINHEYNH